MKLLLLWHMHQPAYKDYGSGTYHLPWTYLHTTKDYFEMPSLARQFDRVRMTFNLAPSLIEAISDYAHGRAKDPWVDLLQKSPDAMPSEERRFLVDNFFTVDAGRYIEPHARYKELYLKRAWSQEFTAEDLLDLQVLFQLAWVGEGLKRHDQTIHRLVRKGSQYSEEDKRALFGVTAQLCRETLDLYRGLWDAGLIELSTTPYYHPILPLLCDVQAARQSTPRIQLPESSFSYPEDARVHTALAVECFEKAFGRRPEGFWPAEGGVSHDALVVLSQYGARWAATDEAILRHSRIRPDDRSVQEPSLLAYQPFLYKNDQADLTLYFRDHTISDLFGFVYQRWNEWEAVDDLMARLAAIQQALPDAVVSVILDGENAWEHYPHNGYDFLSVFYERLDETPWIETSTFTECSRTVTRQGRIESLHPGSWIGANFYTWIGDEEKNRAWEYLKRARDVVRRHTTADGGGVASSPLLLSDRVPELVRQSMLAAEGSDWFWWFGPTHSSLQDPIFDLLFRTHLKNVYVGLNQPWPAYLDSPVAIYRGALHRQPVAFMTPVIDGMDSDYFEWLSAGVVNLQAHGAMHRTATRLSRLLFGFDRDHVYLRVDFDRPAYEALTVSRLRIELYSAKRELTVEVAPGESRPDAACHDIVEVKVPYHSLEITFGQPFDVILVIKDTHELERFPQDGSMTLVVPQEDLEVENWMV